MRKSIISILLLLLCISFALADGYDPPGNSVAGFKINVPSGSRWLDVFFYSYPSIEHVKPDKGGSAKQSNNSVTSLDSEEDGSVPRLAFRVKTRLYYEENLRLTFSPMINDDQEVPENLKYGFYSVTIYNPLYWNDDYLDEYVSKGVLRTFDVDEKSGVSITVTTPAKHIPASSDNIDTWLYAMAFDFSSYIRMYDGDYTATIKLEVVSK